MIGETWCLITAQKDDGSFNTMTASWGGLGVLWGQNVATIYVRPQRYTNEFIKASDYFTLSFFNEEYRDKLSLCGSKSGRDIDKVKICGFTPIYENGVYFKEAKLVLVCRKLYADAIKPQNFIDKKIERMCYPLHDYHEVYIGAIEKVIENK